MNITFYGYFSTQLQISSCDIFVDILKNA